jgi:DeoR/GlpR family transcriptional regulator of sugar metabolism
MFSAMRIFKLKEILLQQKTVGVLTLQEELQVSDVTIRKYLNKLEEEGFIKKFHGGAMLVEKDPSGEVSEALSPLDINSDPIVIKQIAKLAATLVEENDAIFIGPGGMGVALAKELSNFKNLSVLTNNINAVPFIKPKSRNLYCIGGEISSMENYFFSCGNKTLAQLEGIFIHKAFYSVDGIDLMAGITVNNPDLFEFLNKINSNARKLIVMAEHQKFDKIGMHRLNSFTANSTFVSDKKLADKYKKFFFDNNIKVLTSYDI